MEESCDSYSHSVMCNSSVILNHSLKFDSFLTDLEWGVSSGVRYINDKASLEVCNIADGNTFAVVVATNRTTQRANKYKLLNGQSVPIIHYAKHVKNAHFN